MSQDNRIYLYAYISPDAALAAGRSVAGNVDLPLTDEWVAMRNSDQLAVVQEFSGIGPCQPGGGSWRCGRDVNPGHSTWSGPSLAEPTLEAAQIVIDAIVAGRRDVAAKEAEKEAAHRRELGDKAAELAAGPEDNLVYEQYNGHWCTSSKVYEVREVAPGLEERAIEISEERTAAGIARMTARNAELEEKRRAAAAAKKAQLDAWVADHGSESQRLRYKEGLLPEEELWSGIRAMLFAPLGSLLRYERLRDSDIDHGEYCGGDCEISYSATEAEDLDAVSFERLQQIRDVVAGLDGFIHAIVPRIHRAWPACEPEDTDDLTIVRLSALISADFAGKTLSREFALS